MFHVGLVALASVLPEGRQTGAHARDELFTPGAVIPVEAVEPRVARAEPTMPQPSQPRFDEPASAPDERSPSGEPSPPGAEPQPEPDSEDSDPSEEPGMLLHGMRESARPSTAGDSEGKVVVPPGSLHGSHGAYRDSIPTPGVGEGDVQGPAPAKPGGVDYSFEREKGKLVYRDPHGRFVATLRSDGRVDFRNKGGKATMKQIGMAGPGDLLMAASGSDPYARLKAKLLEATFEMRLNMAVGFQKKQLSKRLSRLEGELDKIWADPRRNLGARKELLFQRWDECDEPEEISGAPAQIPGFGIESSDLDDARHDAARSARRLIERFVREHAPRGSDEAFTPAELSDMNRRRISNQAFKPYG